MYFVIVYSLIVSIVVQEVNCIHAIGANCTSRQNLPTFFLTRHLTNILSEYLRWEKRFQISTNVDRLFYSCSWSGEFLICCSRPIITTGSVSHNLLFNVTVVILYKRNERLRGSVK